MNVRNLFFNIFLFGKNLCLSLSENTVIVIKNRYCYKVFTGILSESTVLSTLLGTGLKNKRPNLIEFNGD